MPRIAFDPFPRWRWPFDGAMTRVEPITVKKWLCLVVIGLMVGAYAAQSYILAKTTNLREVCRNRRLNLCTHLLNFL